MQAGNRGGTHFPEGFVAHLARHALGCRWQGCGQLWSGFFPRASLHSLDGSIGGAGAAGCSKQEAWSPDPDLPGAASPRPSRADWEPASRCPRVPLQLLHLGNCMQIPCLSGFLSLIFNWAMPIGSASSLVPIGWVSIYKVLRTVPGIYINK